MMRSLQARLVIGLAAGTAIVFVAASLLLLHLTRVELYRDFDVSLASEARAIAALVEDENGRIQTEIAENDLKTFQTEAGAVRYSIWNRDGVLLEQSRDLRDVSIAPFGGTLDRPQFRSLTLPGNVRARMVGVRFSPHRSSEYGKDRHARANSAPALGDITLVAVRSTKALHTTLARISQLMLAVLGGTIFVLMLVAWPIIRAGLRPLKRISAQIKLLDTGGLGQQLDTANAPVEVTSVIDCLNDLLTRLHEAFERERAFSASVAHELRTPLAGLHATIDVALAKPIDSADDRRALNRCLTICKQSEVLTQNLLLLARLDASQYRLQTQVVLVDQLLREAWLSLTNHANMRDLKVAWAIDEPIEVTSDPTLLALIIRNLLDNAVTYSEEHGTVDIRAGKDGRCATVEIRNTIKGASEDLERHVFDRFWRGNKSRAGTGEHFGLGLPLSRQAAVALAAQLSVSVGERSFTTTLRLPTPVGHDTVKAGGVPNLEKGGQR